MFDPWDVKSTRQSDQYQSCMRINGVPLLPPMLSSECRKEMQYYKLLAKEVEERISKLKLHKYTNNIEDDTTDGAELVDYDPEIVEYEENELQTTQHLVPSSPKDQNEIQSDSDFIVDVNVKVSHKKRDSNTSSKRNSCDLPEQDIQNTNRNQKEIAAETNNNFVIKQLMSNIFNNGQYETLQDGPSSLSNKSFTSSLNDLHCESTKVSPPPTLTRQRSYTLLHPSPQLQAHLEIQSLNTGVDVQSISMSDSPSISKKRRSWDLETAKVNWTSMAKELKNNIGTKSKTNLTQSPYYNSSKTNLRKPQQLNRSLQERPRKTSYSRTSSLPIERSRTAHNIRPKSAVKEPTSPVLKAFKNSPNTDKNLPSTDINLPTLDKNLQNPDKNSQNSDESQKQNIAALISKSEDPAARVKELYEKLQNQHLMQMASLMEKQKKEQQLLQQVFDEQNSLLLKQLKMVCPKVSVEVKQAWVDDKDSTDQGPVSLSQLINTPTNSIPNSPSSRTLTETNSYLNKCDSVLKESRDIIDSLRNRPRAVNKVNNTNGTDTANTKTQATKCLNGSASRSPVRNTSRRLNYETSASSEYEPILTDRTNDTMADLNVTFPSDNEEMSAKSTPKNTTGAVSPTRKYADYISARRSFMNKTPTQREREAASRIVAYARGYLVRRLMRTERVQTVVQTIRDALVCALQLHQDRAGIRGADVDLHRRLIQQITAACYQLHDTFISSSPAERCGLIAADRALLHTRLSRQTTPRSSRRNTDVMSQSHSGAFPARPSRPASASPMTHSHYEWTSNEVPLSRSWSRHGHGRGGRPPQRPHPPQPWR